MRAISTALSRQRQQQRQQRQQRQGQQWRRQRPGQRRPGRVLPVPALSSASGLALGCWWVSTVLVLGALLSGVGAGSASAADNPYQRGPDPTAASVAAASGTFATASVNVPPGNGFGGGTIYYPTDSSRTYGGVAIVPGYTAKFAVEGAWMGHRLASFGFVVIGIETNSTTDFDTSRGTQLLAALDYLTQASPARDRVDPNRLSVVGHSMGGGGALSAAVRRPALKAAVGLAPYFPSGNLTTDRVPTLIIAGQQDTVVTPAYLDGLHATLPASTEQAFVQIAGADHLFPTRANTVQMRTMIPWLKIFVDEDARYSQFLCPLADPTGISIYRNSCPLLPDAGPTPSATPTPSTSATVTASPTAAPGAACSAQYRTVNTWPGGFQGEITVRAGQQAISGWSVGWALSGGQSLSQVWSGTASTSASGVVVTNTAWNGALAASAGTTFGFIATGTASTPTLSCTSQ